MMEPQNPPPSTLPFPKQGDGVKNGEGSKGALPKTYQNAVFDYNDIKEEHIGQGSGRLPYFDGQYYDHWNCNMMMYLEYMNHHVARITENGFLWEDRDNPTTKDQTNMHRNAMVASAIVFALSPIEYARVAGIKDAHQIWVKLEMTHEGIDAVKDVKLESLQSEFNLFIMGLGEGPREVHDRLMRIVNQRKALGAQISDLEVNKRLLQAL